MFVSILHRGIPIGDVDLDLASDPAVGLVATLPSYEQLRERVLIATRALQASISGASDASLSLSAEAIASGAALGRELELRDRQGAPIQTDIIELTDWETDPLGVTVWVRMRRAPDGSPTAQGLIERR